MFERLGNKRKLVPTRMRVLLISGGRTQVDIAISGAKSPVLSIGCVYLGVHAQLRHDLLIVSFTHPHLARCTGEDGTASSTRARRHGERRGLQAMVVTLRVMYVEAVDRRDGIDHR
ncbi:hypothetical protein BV352_05578 [Pseudomonas syringae pv. actinidiae]|nr:hypothetical protein BV352_05578 [Pseudomonas syringae pv. actinidiae]